MPPSGFSEEVVQGALVFVGGCYRDLLCEVRSGKHKSFEDAIEFELAQIKRALATLHIDERGNLVQREVQQEKPGDPIVAACTPHFE